MEAKLKHLEFIQNAIGRMAKNSFLFKGWAISFFSALAGFAVVQNRRPLLLIALLSTILFWALDGYYLWLERGFVDLYKRVSRVEPQDVDFCMVIDKSDALGRWLRTCFRPHICMFYGVIATVEIIAIFVVRRR